MMVRSGFRPLDLKVCKVRRVLKEWQDQRELMVPMEQLARKDQQGLMERRAQQAHKARKVFKVQQERMELKVHKDQQELMVLQE